MLSKLVESVKKLVEPSVHESYGNGEIYASLEMFERGAEKAAHIHRICDTATCKTEAHAAFVRGVRNKLADLGYPRGEQGNV